MQAIRRTADGADIHDGDGGTRRFSRVVVATHPDQALRLLAAPTRAERDVLGAFRYSSSQVVLHTDTRLLPHAPAARASWNYLLHDCAGSAARVHVSYDLNRLQGLDEQAGYVVTLNTIDRIRPGSVIERMIYEHSLCTPQSVAAQRQPWPARYGRSPSFAPVIIWATRARRSARTSTATWPAMASTWPAARS